MELLTTILWILVALFVGPTFYFGYVKVIAEPDKVRKFSTWGYSIKVMQLIGVIEIIAAVAILFPEIRLFGIIVWAVLLTGAVFTHLVHKEPKKEVISVLSILVHLMIIFALNFWLNNSIN